MNISSKLLSDVVDVFASLPGIGKKTALRLALHMLNSDEAYTIDFCTALADMKANIRFCQQCNNISDQDLCSICVSPRRDPSLICVVENLKDLMAIENTGHYQGLYHILGALISPIDGIGPEQLDIPKLVERAAKPETKELIMAVSPSIEGETTIFYLSKQLADIDVKISNIARGVSFGGELHYADEITLGRSILSRTPYQK